MVTVFAQDGSVYVGYDIYKEQEKIYLRRLNKEPKIFRIAEIDEIKLGERNVELFLKMLDGNTNTTSRVPNRRN